jgi:hypothetical protein
MRRVLLVDPVSLADQDHGLLVDHDLPVHHGLRVIPPMEEIALATSSMEDLQTEAGVHGQAGISTETPAIEIRHALQLHNARTSGASQR